jgi:hypothetical protein
VVKAHYQHLVQRRLGWFDRMVVPTDVRDIVGQTILIKTTGCTDQHEAALKAVPIVKAFRRRIAVARQAGKRLQQVTAEQLADRYRMERAEDPERAESTRIVDVINFVLTAHGHGWLDHARQVSEAGNDVHEALRRLPDAQAAIGTADLITGHATPFLSCLGKWRPQAGLKPRPLDQAISSVKQFAAAVAKPIEQIENRDVQKWIDGLINPNEETGIRFMRMDDKTTTGNRFVPIHSEISGLIDQLSQDAERDGYLIASNAKNKYGERSQPIGKRLGRLKTDPGFDGRHVFHSLRKTVAHLLETAECPPGVAKDLIGHAKTDMTFGIYSGETRMDHRARWVETAIKYPSINHDHRPLSDQTDVARLPNEQFEPQSCE